MINLLLTVLFSCHAFAAKTSFANSEVVFPQGKTEIEKFLNLLKDPANRKVAGLAEGPVTYKEIPQEKSAIFNIGPESYMLYRDDMNNSGEKIYLLIFLFSGSGSYSGVQGAYKVEGNSLKSLNFADVVVKNLFPTGDMSRFHQYLARPFAVHINGTIYLRFLDQPVANAITTYVWRKQEFHKADL